MTDYVEREALNRRGKDYSLYTGLTILRSARSAATWQTGHRAGHVTCLIVLHIEQVQ
jgi:hypothetical protein